MNVDRRESRELCTIASTDFAQTHVDRIAGSVLPLVSHFEYMSEGQMDGRLLTDALRLPLDAIS